MCQPCLVIISGQFLGKILKIQPLGGIIFILQSTLCWQEFEAALAVNRGRWCIWVDPLAHSNHTLNSCVHFPWIELAGIILQVFFSVVVLTLLLASSDFTKIG